MLFRLAIGICCTALCASAVFADDKPFHLEPLRPVREASAIPVFESSARIDAAPGKVLSGLDFAPDGTFLAAAGTDKRVYLFQPGSWKLLHRFEGMIPFLCVAVSPDSHKVAAGGWGGVDVWNANTGLQIAHYPLTGGAVRGIRFLPDNDHFVTGDEGGAVRTFSVSMEKQTASFPADSTGGQCIWSISLSSDGKRVAAGMEKGEAAVWTLADGRQLSRFNTSTNHGVYGVSLSADGKTLLTAGNDQPSQEWNVDTGACARTLPVRGTITEWIARHASSKLLFLSGDEYVTALSADDLSPRFRLAGPVMSCLTTVVSPDLHWVVSYTGDGYDPEGDPNDEKTGGHLHCWDLATPPRIDASAAVLSVVVSPDQKTTASLQKDNSIRMWSTGNFEVLSTVHPKSPLAMIAFSPDSRQILAAGKDGTLSLISCKSQATVEINCRHPIFSIAPLSETTAAVGTDAAVVLVDFKNPAVPVFTELQGHHGPVTALASCPGVSRLVSAAKDKTVRVWDLTSHSELFQLARPIPGEVDSLVLDHKGKSVVLCDRTYGPILYALDTGAPLRQFTVPYNSQVTSVAWSPDDSCFACAGALDARVAIFKPDEVEPVAKCGAPLCTLSSVAMIDSTHVVAGSADATLTRWGFEVPSADFEGIHALGFVCVESVSDDGAVGFSDAPITAEDRTMGIAVWDLSRKSLIARIPGFIHVYALSADHEKFFYPDKDGCKVVDLASRATEVVPVQKPSQIRAPAVSPDGHLLAVATCDEFKLEQGNTITLYDLQTKKPLFQMRGHHEPIRSLRFSPDGQWLASSSGQDAEAVTENPDGSTTEKKTDRTLHLWKTDTGKEARVITVGAAACFFAFSPDSNRFIVLSYDGLFTAYSVPDFHEKRRVRNNQFGDLGAAAMSADGKWLLVANAHGRSQLFSADTFAAASTPPIIDPTAINGWPVFLPSGEPAVFTNARNTLSLLRGKLP